MTTTTTDFARVARKLRVVRHRQFHPEGRGGAGIAGHGGLLGLALMDWAIAMPPSGDARTGPRHSLGWQVFSLRCGVAPGAAVA